MSGWPCSNSASWRSRTGCPNDPASGSVPKTARCRSVTWSRSTSASAPDAAAAIARAARHAGWDARELPISDGGEGLVDCFGGPNQYTDVSGPLGAQVRAGWRHDGEVALLEMAAASGIALVGERND